MNYTLNIEIKNQLPLSLNKALRAHYHKFNRQNALFRILVAVETIGKLPPSPLKKARIRLVRHAHRTLDYDGLVGSMKPVVDALVKLKILEDDSWAVTGPWEVTQVFRPMKDGTRLQIHVESV